MEMKTEITIDEALKNKALKYKILQNMELQEENSNLSNISEYGAARGEL